VGYSCANFRTSTPGRGLPKKLKQEVTQWPTEPLGLLKIFYSPCMVAEKERKEA